ncbi:hypothetical protein PRIPAC_97022 [Pristionchus pacificus]|uniref:RNA binding protein n=1 Tax=Pristionchus pacificus TaxID=54126 RepID=A0A2A6CGY8_PRIPA|nr:hypothetical protein PRIPAC_97022 [Pristionchus pacificus]|eukprot:PDM77357.1 RNA binding protein [Pristionchus pacificus]
MVKSNDFAGSDGEPEHARKLFIGGLTPNTTEEMMREFYAKFGDIVDVVVMRDPTTKRTRGFGFVTYAAKTMVDKCQNARPHVIDGKTVDPKRAVPRDANDRGAGNVSSKRLYVSGIREEHTDAQLDEYFQKFGTIEKVDIIKDKMTNKNRGFAFINFLDYDSVDKCVIMKSHQINGYRCDVKKGLSKEETAKAQQSERDRNDRNSRSRGSEGGRGGRGGGGYDGGMGGGGAWGGYGGGQPHGEGGWAGYGQPSGGGGWGGAAAQPSQSWVGAGGAQGGYGGGYGAPPAAGAAQQAWGGQQQPAAAAWGQRQQSWAGATGGGQAHGGYGGGQGGQQGGRRF